MLTIYNTLTRKKEEFIPSEKGKINMYVCGPTVYDVPHIGHARSAYVFDVIRRYLEYKGFEVTFVRNVTDIDDKIINKAVSELSGTEELKEKVKEIAVKYLEVYHKQLQIFGIMQPTCEPKATENISQMIGFIEKIIGKGYGYVSGGDVYFSVDKFEGYGKLSNRNKEEMVGQAAADRNDKKKYPLDFALWKSAKENEPSWESPWGKGRPGWHIECSVMSTKILGEGFDIHGGGLDLIFPHHENEIAQTEAVTGKSFAKYWVHNGLLTVNGEKMSKSLGNYITIMDFLDEYKDPDILKISFLNSQYRSPMDYGADKMAASRSSKERIKIFIDKADKIAVQSEIKQGDIDSTQRLVSELREKFTSAMDDDFNSPLALAVIFEAVKKGNEVLALPEIKGTDIAVVSQIKDFVLEAADVFGLSFGSDEIDANVSEEIDNLVAEREEARLKRDYARADEIRDELLDKGITLEDTPEGPQWRKK